jgi:hypothetical protein
LLGAPLSALELRGKKYGDKTSFIFWGTCEYYKPFEAEARLNNI